MNDVPLKPPFNMKWLAVLSLVLVTSAAASQVITVPLTKVKRSGPHLKGVAAADRARAALLKTHSPTTIPAVNLQYVQYTAAVGIGKPPTYYNLAVDTGSSNTFCGTGIPYNRTSTSIPTGQPVNVTYGLGNFSGFEYLDQVTIAPNLVITNQSIGDALQSSDFQGVDGIVGLGPVDLTLGTLAKDKNATIPTVMNNLVSQKLIERQVLGVYFAPATNVSDENGALTYGGVDHSLYEGELTYINITKTHPSSLFWGINITLATYGNHTVIPTPTAGIVDTGTTLVAMADNFFDVYMAAIPGSKLDNATGLLEIPPSSISQMQPLNFLIANRVFALDVAAQLFPTYQNIPLGGVAGKQYGTVGNMGNGSQSGLDFVLGQKFVERYYAVFDADKNRVGFAQTNNTFTTYKG